MLSIFQSIVLVFSICTFLAALISQLVFVLTRRHLVKVAAKYRVRILSLLVILPVLITFLVLIKGFAPSFLTLLGFPQDHCIIHCLFGGADHTHLCLLSPPAFIHNPVILLLSFGLVVTFIYNLQKTIIEIIDSRKLMLRFRGISQKIVDKNYYRIETDKILAVSMGFFKPIVFISSGLEARLTPRELDLVLEHEHGHGCRKDLLRILLMKFLGIFFLPVIFKKILSDLSLASEQICDERAAKSVCSKLLVAETILKVQKLVPRVVLQPVLANYFSEQHIIKRITVLLDDDSIKRKLTFSMVGYFVLLMTGVFFVIETSTTHQLIEVIYNILL